MVRRLDRHMTDFIRNSTDVDQRTLYVNGWTPPMEPHIHVCKNLLKNLLAQTFNFKSERYNETRVLT